MSGRRLRSPDNVLLFGRVLRAAGLEVHHGRMVDAIRALEWIGVRSRATSARRCAACWCIGTTISRASTRRSTLFFRAPARRRPGLPLFSLGERPRVVGDAGARVAAALEVDGRRPGAAADARAGGRRVERAECSRTKDFARLHRCGARTRARRCCATCRGISASGARGAGSARARGAVDLRPLLRRNLMRGGELLDLPRRGAARRAAADRRARDVSGSMERYSRVLLHFVYGLAHSADARRELRVRDAADARDAAADRAAGATGASRGSSRDVQDWGGGTRIGEALRAFNIDWARRVMRNGPVVLIVSDGWDRGDPALLARELARVRRSCRRLIWLNPLLGSASYEPLTRGMQAALPHVDDFLPAHNLASLEQLAHHLRALPTSRPVNGSRSTRGRV